MAKEFKTKGNFNATKVSIALDSFCRYPMNTAWGYGKSRWIRHYRKVRVHLATN